MGALVKNFKQRKELLQEEFNKLEKVLDLIGCGITLKGNTIYIYEGQHNYLSLLVDEDIHYEFMEYPQFA